MPPRSKTDREQATTSGMIRWANTTAKTSGYGGFSLGV